MYMVAKCFDNSEMIESREHFSMLDVDFDGYISTEELRTSLLGLKDNH
jgi:Ca2+-binding EF-hand superfamily protein